MREYRKEKVRKHPLILSDTPLSPEEFKFQSMYEFVDVTLDIVQDNKSTANLQGMPVRSNVLFIDIDTTEEEVLDSVREALKPYTYQEYFSGSKGYHFHVPHQDITSTDLVYSHRLFVESLGISHLVDTSIYRESGLIRLADSVHEVTGKTKKLINKNSAKTLELPIVEAPPWQIDVEESTPEAVSLYKRNLLNRVTIGNRHRHFYILYKTGLRAGRSLPSIIEDCKWYNKRLEAPKDESDLMKELRGFI